MLLKSADEKSHFVTQLQDILAHPSLARERKPFVEKEIRALQTQIETQSQSGRAIDEFLEMSEQVVVLHDLRLPHNGRTVNVDHVLINLSLEVVVLSTQHFASGLKMTSKGEFEKVVAGRSSAIRNPLEDSAKALDAVKEACRSMSWPTRLGVQLLPEYRHWVLLHPNASIVRDVPTIFPSILSADEFLLEYVRSNASLKQGLVSLARGVSIKTLEQLATRLVSLHRPLKDDLATRFGIKGMAGPGLEAFRTKPRLPAPSVASISTLRPATPLPPRERAATSEVLALPADTSPARPVPVRATSSRIGSNSPRVPSLRKPVAVPPTVSAPPVANRALDRAVAAGALAPRRAADAKGIPVRSEPRAPAPPLRVPDQPDSFRKDASLRAELLRPRSTVEHQRPEVPRVAAAEARKAVVTVTAAVAPAELEREEAVVKPVPAPSVAPAPVAQTPRAPDTAGAGEAKVPNPQGYYCKDCTVEVTMQTAKFCWQNKHRFSGRVYCSSCQEKHPAPSFPRREPRPVRQAG
jgi:hypothetical protein